MILLRALELGLRMSDLDDFTVGEIFDILTERANDSYDWEYEATEEDIANF